VESGQPTASTTSVLRVINERAVYERIRLDGPVSRPELARATGLSKPTISLALADLERVGLVRAIGHRTGGAGRAAALYEMVPDAGAVLAIDVGVAWVRAALVDLAGGVVARKDVPAQPDDVQCLVRQLAGLAAELAGATSVTYTVLGMPGIHDVEAERLRLAPNLPGWDAPGSTGLLAAALPGGFLIENDIALAALGEQAYGRGLQVRDFVYFSIGTGVGMGIVLNGRLYRGARGAAGEVGFLPLGESDPLASAPDVRRHGMLESILSASGVVATARRFGMSGDLTPELVWDAARSGDPAATRAVRHEAGSLSRALASVIAVLDPELVVVGGGLGSAGEDVLLPAVRDELAAMTPLGPPPVEVSALGSEAVVQGAIATGLTTARDLVFDRALA